MYRLTNNGPQPRVVTDRRGRTVNIAPGKSVDVDLKQSTAENLKIYSSKYLQVDGEPEVLRRERINPGGPGAMDGKTHLASVQKASRQKEGEGGAQTDDETKSVKKPSKKEQATSLLERYQKKEIEFQQFSNEAEVLLGDKWPGGKPRKATVIAHLEDLQDAED